MGWAIGGGVLGLILMFGAYRWLVGWATVRSGGVSIPTIGTRPRRLAGVPEEAPADAKMPPAMEVLRHGEAPVIVEPRDAELTHEVAGGVAGEAVVFPETDFPVEAALHDVEDEGDAEAPVATVMAPKELAVVVAQINHGSEDSGEFVVIANSGSHAVDLSGWRLTDVDENHAFDFPSVVLPPQGEIRVHMWRGEDTATDLYVGRRSHWWNNEGDTAFLYDSTGSLVHRLSTVNED